MGKYHRSVWTADIHVSNTLPYAKRGVSELPPMLGTGLLLRDSYTDRLMDTLLVLERVFMYARENGIKLIWILGDLLDRRLLDAATLKAFTDVFLGLVDSGEEDERTIIVPGNHESHDASGSVYTVSALEHIRPNRVTVWNGTSELDLRDEFGLRFIGFPYKPDAVARDEVRRIRDETCADKGAVLLLHQSLVGGKVGSWVNPEGIMPEDLEGFYSVLSGHFHTPQHVGAARYLGAPLQHNFGDSGEERGFWDITFKPGDINAKLISSNAPAFHSLDWRDEEERGKLYERIRIGDYVEVKLEGTDAEIKSERGAIDDFLRGSGWSSAIRLVKFRPIPLSDKKERSKAIAEAVKSSGKITWPSAVSGYLDHCDLTGLERARLEEIASAALAEAEAAS